MERGSLTGWNNLIQGNENKTYSSKITKKDNNTGRVRRKSTLYKSSYYILKKE